MAMVFATVVREMYHWLPQVYVDGRTPEELGGHTTKAFWDYVGTASASSSSDGDLYEALCMLDVYTAA